MDARWKDFLHLAEQARDDSAPHVDVTHRVLATIAHSRQGVHAHTTDRPLLLCTAGALLAASVVAILASGSWIALNDPLSDLITGLSVLNP